MRARSLDVKVLGQNMKLAREGAGLSRAEIARELGVTRQAVALWEGGTCPSLMHMCAYAEQAGVSAQSLLLGAV